MVEDVGAQNAPSGGEQPRSKSSSNGRKNRRGKKEGREKGSKGDTGEREEKGIEGCTHRIIHEKRDTKGTHTQRETERVFEDSAFCLVSFPVFLIGQT